MKQTLRLIVYVGLWIAGVAVVPAGAVPITVTQEHTYSQVNGWSVLTNGSFTATEWSQNPFPSFTSITQIVFTFTSTDSDFVDGIGPQGAPVSVGIGVRNNAFQKLDITSLNRTTTSVTINGSWGQTFTNIAAQFFDGAVVATMGGYEYQSGWLGVRDYTLHGTSTLRIQVTGDAPPPPPAVPEPATLALVGFGLLGVTHGLRRPRAKR